MISVSLRVSPLAVCVLAGGGMFLTMIGLWWMLRVKDSENIHVAEFRVPKMNWEENE